MVGFAGARKMPADHIVTIQSAFRQKLIKETISNILDMTVAIQIILGVLTVICFLGGANILVKGAGYFLPKETPPQVVLDNVVRFLAGVYFGMGFLLVWAVCNVGRLDELIYFLGIVVCCSGLGRLYSRIRMGPGSRYLFIVMCFEIALGLALILLQYLR
jgi:hypothetical protein